MSPIAIDALHSHLVWGHTQRGNECPAFLGSSSSHWFFSVQPNFSFSHQFLSKEEEERENPVVVPSPKRRAKQEEDEGERERERDTLVRKLKKETSTQKRENIYNANSEVDSDDKDARPICTLTADIARK